MNNSTQKYFSFHCWAAAHCQLPTAVCSFPAVLQFSLFVFFVLFRFSLIAQNLVPNPSFEQFDTCPYNGGQINYVKYWYNPTPYASPDYFNACGTLGYNVPNSYLGYQTAKSGIAYAGIVTYTKNSLFPAGDNYREYISIALNDTLRGGHRYCLSFYVSKADTAQYIANDIGGHFSISPDTNSTTQNTVLPFIPQVSNPSNNTLSNDTGWTEISGSFIASGGEKYLTIGNFKDSSSTTASYVGGPSWMYYGYYYIDDITVVLCDSLNGITETGFIPKINIYPNISQGLYNVESNFLLHEISVHNLYGHTVYQKKNISSNKTIIDIESVDAGMYVITVYANNNYSFSEKVIKIN
ncbi:MAG: T9SS type A sorting domain-containing protein [Bacteroidetes bacterium]|nr:T9SS type A sorting domain-containing protein [Bacteroidota bacterium]